METDKTHWSSERLFIMASIGGAVGLGNLVRFPVIAGENGGGAFMLVYLLLVLLIGMPLLLSEFIMGRHGKGGALETMDHLIAENKACGLWRVIGWLSLLLPFLGFCYYSAMVGWTSAYGFEAMMGGFQNITADQSGQFLSDLQKDPFTMIALHTGLLAVTVFVVGSGLKNGIEKTVKLMIPGLFVMLIFLAIYAVVVGDAGAAARFLFQPDFSKINASVVLNALGQVFFSLAVGVGMMITYSAYVPRDVKLSRASAIVGLGDTFVAVVAGMAIFPILLSLGLEPAQGFGLLFVTMPVAFGQMEFGHMLGTIFFVLMFFAAFTSVIGMLEPIVAAFMKRFPNVGRMRLSVAFGAVIWFVGLAPTLSDSLLSDVRPLWFVPLMQDFNVFRVFDFFVANVLLPLNGLLIALFVGWIMTKNQLEEEAGLEGLGFRLWRFLVRFIAPVAVSIVLVSGIINAFS